METVEDIVRDILSRAQVAGRQDGDATVHHSAVAAMLHDLADRLDAAYKRDLQSIVDAGEIDMKTAMGEVERLSAENERLKSDLEWAEKQRAIAKSFHDVAVAERDSERRSVDILRQDVARLKAALNPVLECGVGRAFCCQCAVSEAQRIYNNGGAK